MIIGQDKIPKEAVKYRFSKHWNMFVRTWYTLEQEKNLPSFFRQHIAYSKNRNTDWDKWQTKP